MIETVKNNILNPLYNLVSDACVKVAGFFFNRKVEPVSPKVNQRDVQIAREKMLDLTAEIEYARMEFNKANKIRTKAQTASPEAKAQAQRTFNKAMTNLKAATKAMEDYTAELNSKLK